MARGIDAAAHKASLPTGTVAVMAGGVDAPFPHEHAGLAQEIIEDGGALVSEMPMGWQPRAIDFPRRNRIIAGLSLGVLVVEAAKRSGSLITARLASECGRAVLAIPGSPLDPRAEGTNHLIRQGATLDHLHGRNTRRAGADGRGRAATALRRGRGNAGALRDRSAAAGGGERGHAPDHRFGARPLAVEVDDIIRFTGASTGEVQMILLELALAGRLERHGGNRVSLTL